MQNNNIQIKILIKIIIDIVITYMVFLVKDSYNILLIIKALISP